MTSANSTTAAKTISFARGAPSLDIVDVEGLKAAAHAAFTADPGGLTAYGTSVGYLPLREWIADKHGVAPENVIVTNGSMQADAFLFDALLSEGDTVIVEQPTYDRTLLSLRNRGADVRMIELESDGIDVAALERVLLAGARPKLAHIIPNFQNPAGHTLSLDKRERLLELSREHGFVVFEDDPYVELRFSGERLPTMVSMDPENVVYASSFSKTVAPGIRVGYLVGPRPVIARIEKLATSAYISPNMVAQGIVNQFARSGARRCAFSGAAAWAPRGSVPGAGGGLLHVGRAASGRGGRRAVHRRRRARGPVRQGQRLRARGLRVLAPPCLLGRHPRGDRGGRVAPGRRLPRGHVGERRRRLILRPPVVVARRERSRAT